MSLIARIPGVAPAFRALKAAARAAWRTDRTVLSTGRRLGIRLFRIAVVVGRGVVVHRLGMLAGALTFFTVFSIVPVLAVVLWVLKLLDHLPVISTELPQGSRLLTGNELLHAALAEVVTGVQRAGEVTGVVGLVTLLYVASKMFSFTERALHTIAGAGRRSPQFTRALGYVGLLLLPVAVLGLSGTLVAALRQSLGHRLDQLMGAIPGGEMVLVAATGLAALWFAATLLYWAAVRAAIPFTSAAVGGVAAALALPVVFWAYANLQIGVSKWSAVGSGFIAFPVFLLWSFSSWYTVLVGAEIAVAHHTEKVLARGARAFHLDLAGERETSATILALLAGTSSPAARPLAEDCLSSAVRLPPQLVRDLCARLVDRGLVAEDRRGFCLGRDVDQTAFAAVLDAIDRDPALEDVHRDAERAFPSHARRALSLGAALDDSRNGPTLGQVAQQSSLPPIPPTSV